VLLTHACVQGWDPSRPGHATFAADPRFISTADLRLSPDSPCIDAGNAAHLPADSEDIDTDNDTDEPIPLDIAGRTRVVSTAPDIGAYERQPDECRADHTGDAVLNSADYFAYLADYFANAIITRRPARDPRRGPLFLRYGVQ
jgi:hypothetical protein